MPKAFINNINMYYEEHGRGFPLVLTHGFAGTSQSWAGQVPAFSKKYRFITYDMRGHGQADAPEDIAFYTQDFLVQDLSQLLWHLRVRKAVVGGLSLGGYLSIHFYQQHPELVAALILIDTGPGFRTPEKAKDWNEARRQITQVLETKGPAALLTEPVGKLLYYTSPEIMKSHSAKGLANISLGVMMSPWGLDLLPQIKVPTLIICGDRDVDFLPAAEYMAQKIPGARKVIIPDAGHGVNIDQPRAFEAAVLDFLDGLRLKA